MSLKSREIPFLRLGETHRRMSDRLNEAARRVIESGWYLDGPEAKALEREFADACGVAHGFAVGSGSEAIFLALRTLGIGPGDQVIVAGFDAPAGIAAVRLSGAEIVLADISDGDYTLDPESAAARITDRTRALVPVHLFGFPCRMEEIGRLADRHGLEVIEDCAQAAGAAIGGRTIGSFGRFAAFSFYPTKNLGALGDAGMVLTGSDRLAEALRDPAFTGVAARMDEIQAAFLREKLPLVEEWNERRRQIAARYLSGLAGLVTMPRLREGVLPVYHQFPIRTPERDALKNYLAESGIGTMIHYPSAISELPGYRKQSCPVAERVAGEILSLPIDPYMEEGEVDRVIEAIGDFFEGKR